MARGIYRLGNIKSRGAQIVVKTLGVKKLEIYEDPCSLYALKNIIFEKLILSTNEVCRKQNCVVSFNLKN